jgi:hypothetical protein
LACQRAALFGQFFVPSLHVPDLAPGIAVLLISRSLVAWLSCAASSMNSVLRNLITSSPVALLLNSVPLKPVSVLDCWARMSHCARKSVVWVWVNLLAWLLPRTKAPINAHSSLKTVEGSALFSGDASAAICRSAYFKRSVMLGVWR